jgi:glycosyltransferase involved in cell wall biosynthesis
MPLVSVVIPAHNAERTIRATIASVLNQTITDLEIIVVDDGSQDGTVAIAHSFSDPRIQVISKPNGGVAVARNCGIACTTGEFIAFLDADDCWKTDKLEKQLAALQANPKAAVAYSWTDWIDESGQFLRHGRHLSPSGNVYAALLTTNFLENGSNLLVRRSALMQVGGFDESLSRAHDWEMGLRLAAQFEFAVVRSPQILYRASPDSLSTHITQAEQSCLQILTRNFASAGRSLQSIKRQSFANLYLFLTLKTLDSIPSRYNRSQAASYWLKTVYYDVSLLKKRTKLMMILAVKITLGLVFGLQIAQILLKTMTGIFSRSEHPHKHNGVEKPN